MFLQGGELIFGCKDAAEQTPDMSALAQQLRPYFTHNAGLYKGHLSAKAVLNEFIQVVSSALLSSWSCSRTAEPKKVHPADARGYCEASPLHRDLLRNGQPCSPVRSCGMQLLLVTAYIPILCE